MKQFTIKVTTLSYNEYPSAPRQNHSILLYTRSYFLRKYLSVILVLVVVFSLLLSATYAFASTTTESNQHVFDKAELLSTIELTDLEKMCTEYGNDAGVEIMILTHDDPNAVNAETYIENFEDQLPVGDRVYLLIDMQNRDVFMESYGLARTNINSDRSAIVIDEITPSLSSGEYYDAFAEYIKSSAAYMKDAPLSVTSVLANLWVQLLIAIVIGAISVAVMAFNSGGKMTTGGNTYMDPNNSGLIGRRDDYIRTQVTRIRKPQNNNTGGVSAGGRSHSSAGGKF